MKIVAIAILIIVVIAVLLRSRQSSGKKSKTAAPRPTQARVPGNTTRRTNNAFPAVSISTGPNACEAAIALEKTRFLSGDAPLLPLADCTSATCTCKYAHYEDRRDAQEERRQPFSLRTDMYESTGNKDRRDKSGRREDEQ